MFLTLLVALAGIPLGVLLGLKLYALADVLFRRR